MVRSAQIFLLTISLTFSPSCFQADEKDQNALQTDYSATIDQTEKKIRRLIRKHNLPGLAITLIDDKDIVYQNTFGFANIERDIQVSPETTFKLWSISKVFTAMEIFREVEEGIVDLDAPIIKYLPDFSIQEQYVNRKPITIRNILAHRSGLPRNECVSVLDSINGSVALEKFEKSTSDCFMAYPVEYRYKYSNLGYAILGRIIEQTRGDGYASYMNNNILHTLGMDNSTFSSANISNPQYLAMGYEHYKGEYYPMDQSVDISSVPSGNLYSTIEDLSVFLKAVFANNGFFRNKETISLMFEDHYSNISDPETMGLGWKTSSVLGTEFLVWHDGGPVDGTGSLVAFLPERKLGIAVVANGTSFGGNVSVPLAIEILELMLEEKFDFNAKAPEEQKRKQLEKGLLKSYEGTYVVFGQVMEVQAKNKKLKGKISGIGLDLIPVSETEFKISHWMDRIGLTKIFKPPIEFSKIKIEFDRCNIPDSCNMIINFDNIGHEVCPRYPRFNEIPESWELLAGEYRTAERLPENKVGGYTGSRFSIFVKDNVLNMSAPFGPIILVDEKFISITGGPFGGETIEYNSISGNIIHQDAVFIPTGEGKLK